MEPSDWVNSQSLPFQQAPIASFVLVCSTEGIVWVRMKLVDGNAVNAAY